MNNIKDKLYLATIGKDAPRLARALNIGLELDHFCTAINMDANFAYWDKQVLNDTANINQLILHAPFAEICPCAIDPMIRDVAMHRLTRAVELCKLYNVKRMVVHSGFVPSVYFPEWFINEASKFFRELLLSCDSNFELLIENVLDTEPQPLCDLIDAINDPRARICLDVGHAFVSSKQHPSIWLNTLAPKIAHLHIHDNRADYDSHLVPGYGCIGFPALFDQIQALLPQASITIECIDAVKAITRLREYSLLPIGEAP